MAVLASRQAASALQVRPRAVGAVAVRRSRLVVRAVDQETQTQENQTQAPPAVDFAPQKIEGFVEKDSAGQANMYPTILRPFEAGSDADNAQSQSAESDTRMLAGGAGVLAGLLVVAGLFAATLPSGQPEAQPAGEFQSLSAYQAKFAVELGLNKPAPALVQIPAPALIEPAVEVPEPVAEVARQEEAAPAEEAAVEVPPVVASE